MQVQRTWDGSALARTGLPAMTLNAASCSAPMPAERLSFAAVRPATYSLAACARSSAARSEEPAPAGGCSKAAAAATAAAGAERALGASAATGSVFSFPGG